MELTVHTMIRFEIYISCTNSAANQNCFHLYSSLTAFVVVLEYVHAVRLVCSQFQECDIENMDSKVEDIFMYRYIPADVQGLKYFNLLFDKVDSEFFQTIPAHITSLHIGQSTLLKSISVPGGTNISKLILADNEVNKLVIDDNNTIAELTVSVSKLATIPQSIGNLKAALTIAITNCPIETLNIEMFCDLSKLQILNLEANRIRNIVNTAPTHCSLYDSLQTLSISQNMLKQFNLDPFNNLAKLQRLNAKHNGMVSVRGDFNSGAHLHLCLSKNQLKALDLCRWHVPNMVYLELDYNNLTTIPTCLENLPSVTLLSLSRNQIQHVTIQSFARMSLLEGLDLSYNNLTTIMLNSSQYPASFKCIWLINANLTELNLSVVTVPSLEVDVQTNCISKVDLEQISPNVTKLYMRNNPFDCSWQTVEERSNLACVESAANKARCGH
ncbi:toll-like receptor 6 [Anopheles arabiensis]|uniref:toll-like receptor 6 n=1 Tax=Anopheles arabiensis TaxID=7173 RepID=UPI001AAC7695|nr:toll-like receptor 6 [Anopheles arabiensis]